MEPHSIRCSHRKSPYHHLHKYQVDSCFWPKLPLNTLTPNMAPAASAHGPTGTHNIGARVGNGWLRRMSNRVSFKVASSKSGNDPNISRKRNKRMIQDSEGGRRVWQCRKCHMTFAMWQLRGRYSNPCRQFSEVLIDRLIQP